MAQKIPGNQLSYYQYGDDVVYNLGKNIAGNVTTWSYYPAGNLGVAIGAGIDPAEFEYLPNGPGSSETALGTKTSQDNEPLDIASMNSAYEKQQAALQKSDNAAEQVKAAQDARVDTANTITPEPEESAENLVGSQAKTNAIKDPLKNQLFREPTDEEFAEAEASIAALDAAALDAQPSFPDEDASDPLQTEFVTLEETADVLSGAEFAAFEGSPTTNKDSGEESTGTDVATSTTGTGAGTSGSVSPVPDQFYSKIEATPNPLQAFASYTYSISLYLVNKAGLERLQQGIKSVQGLPLILQSGGAQQSGPDMYGAKRSSFFKDDYYIDNVEMEGFISGTTTQSVHNQHTIRFDITEPYGLTFLENLHNAVKEYKTSLGFPAEKINYASQMYLMVIRFRGHGIDGVPVNLAEMNYQQTGERDTRGFTEKYIPFVFSGINFRVENDKIVYHCEASSPMSFYNLNATHAAIPFNVELNGGTVGDVLGDPAGNLYTAANFDERNDAAEIKKDTKVTVYTGLTEALNVESEKAYGKEFANRYKIIFEEGSGIENKKIILPGSDTNKERAPMKSSKQQPQSGNTDTIKKESRTKSLPAGTSIIQAIEQIVRNSEFVTEQQQIVINERTGEPKIKDKTSNQPFQWFKVVMQATPRSDKVNPKTHDYAYDIVYKIKRYQVGATNSPVFPPPIFRGVHKKYPYWFTGENTEVLHFQQDFNYLYYQTLTEPLPGLKPPVMNTVHVARNYYMPRTNESNDGTTSGAGEISASVASTLYSPGDLATVEVEILGDPDWIAQSEVFYGVDKISNDAFEEDGSVNFNSSVAYFGIEWNGPRDYNDEGLMNPRGDAQYTRKDGTTEPLMSLCYRANTIKTKLAQGQFTQVLSGTLEQWVDDPYTTRVDKGFKYNAQKRVDDITKAQDAAEEAELDRAFAENDALWDKQMQGLSSAESMVAQQDAEFEAELLADRLADEDLAMNQGSLAPTTQEDFPEIFDQGDADQLETWDNVDWGDDEIAPTSTQPALTKVAPAPTTGEQANPNTITQNSITKTGGDKTIIQTPLVEPTPPAPAYSGPGYTEPESNLTLPTGTTNTGVDSDGMIYGDYKGQQILGGTQGAIDAQKRAIDTGQKTTYEDVEYGLTAGDAERVRRKFDPVSGTDEIVAYFNNKTGRWEDAFGNAIQ